MAQDLDSWNPMKDDYRDRRFNSYTTGLGQDLQSSRREAAQGDRSVQLFIRGIPFGLSENGVSKLFSDNGGRVVAVKVPLNQDATKPRFGFVTMADLRGAQEAIYKLNGKKIKNNTLSVQVALSAEEKARRAEKKRMEEEILKSLSIHDDNNNRGHDDDLESLSSTIKTFGNGPNRQAGREERSMQPGASGDGPTQNGRGPQSKDSRAQPAEKLGMRSVQAGKGSGPLGQQTTSVRPGGRVDGEDTSIFRTLFSQGRGQAMGSVGRGESMNRILAGGTAKSVVGRRPQSDEISVSSSAMGAFQCAVCGKRCTKKCGQCQTYYCSRECQLEDWPQHKPICKELAESRQVLGKTKLSKMREHGKSDAYSPQVDLSELDVEVDESFIKEKFFDSILRVVEESSDTSSSSDSRSFQGKKRKSDWNQRPKAAGVPVIQPQQVPQVFSQERQDVQLGNKGGSDKKARDGDRMKTLASPDQGPSPSLMSLNPLTLTPPSAQLRGGWCEHNRVKVRGYESGAEDRVERARSSQTMGREERRPLAVEETSQPLTDRRQPAPYLDQNRGGGYNDVSRKAGLLPTPSFGGPGPRIDPLARHVSEPQRNQTPSRKEEISQPAFTGRGQPATGARQHASDEKAAKRGNERDERFAGKDAYSPPSLKGSNEEDDDSLSGQGRLFTDRGRGGSAGPGRGERGGRRGSAGPGQSQRGGSRGGRGGSAGTERGGKGSGKGGRGGQQGQPKGCFRCGNDGHIARECPGSADKQPGGSKSPQSTDKKKPAIVDSRADKDEEWDTTPSPSAPSSKPASKQAKNKSPKKQTSPLKEGTAQTKSPKTVDTSVPGPLMIHESEQVLVVYFENPQCIFIQKLNDRLLLEQTMSKQLGQDAPQALSSTKKDDMVLCDFGGEPCRARVLNVQSGKANIYYIDYGNKEETPVTNLRSVTGELKTLPGIAVKVGLQVEPVNGGSVWPDSVKEELHETLMVDSMFTITPLSRINNLYIVTLNRLNDNLDVTKHLIARGLARAKTVSSRQKTPPKATVAEQKRFMANNLDSVAGELDVGEKRYLTLADISIKLDLLMQITEKLTSLRNFNAALHQEYATMPMSATPYNPVDGELVAARFQDMKWYRAEVLSMSEKGVQVRFVDFGNEDTCQLSDVRPLNTQYCTLSAQSIRCAIVGVRLPQVIMLKHSQLEMLAECIKSYTEDMKCLAVIKAKEDNCIWLDIIHPQKDQTLAEVLPTMIEEALLPQPVAAPPNPPSVGLDSDDMPLLPEPLKPVTVPPTTAAPIATEKLPSPKTASDAAVAEQEVSGKGIQKKDSKVPNTVLPLDTWIRCGIQEICSSTQFYVIRMEVQDKLDALREALGNYCATTGKNEQCKSVMPGDIVLTQYSSDNDWYRARVEWLSDDATKCRVFFIDYGNSEEQDVKNLKPVPPRFLEMAAQAIPCSLMNLDAPFSREKEKMFRHYCLLVEVQLKVIQCREGVYVVDLHTLDNQPVMDLLKNVSSRSPSPNSQPEPPTNASAQGQPSPQGQSESPQGQIGSPKGQSGPSQGQSSSPQGQPGSQASQHKSSEQQNKKSDSTPVVENQAKPSSQSQAKSVSPVHAVSKAAAVEGAQMVRLDSLRTVEVGKQEIDAVIVHVNDPSDFFCQPLTVIEEQKELHVQLASLCQTAESLKQTPQVGEVLCGLFDGAWFRCVVTNVADGAVSVHFLDYGNDAVVELSDLKPVPPELCTKFPIGAFRCSLHGVKAEGTWSEDACNVLKQIVNMPVNLKVMKQSHDIHSVTITVEGVDFADLMVSNHFAVPEDAPGSQPAAEAPTPAPPGQSGTTSEPNATPSAVDATKGKPVLFDSLQLADPGEKETEVLIVHANSPSEFYCQTLATMSVQQDLVLKLTKYCETADAIKNPPQEKEVVCSPYEGGWYRSVVTSIDGDVASVHFIDYGNDEKVELSSLKPAPYDLCMEVPVGCFKCSLYGIKAPKGGWSPEAVSALNGLVCQPATLQVEGETQGTKTVTIKIGGIDLAQDFVNNKLAMLEGETKEPSGQNKEEPLATQNQTAERKKIMLDSLKTVEPGEGEMEAFIMHAVSPSNFYCQTRATLGEQDPLQRGLMAACETEQFLTGSPQVGEVLCSLYEGEWYRCVITKLADREATVHFIDYGNDTVVDIGALKPVPCELSMKYPVSAFKCSLHGIKPTEAGWSDEVVTIMKQLVMSSPVMLKVEERCEGTYSVTLTLEGVNLADEFVSKQLAVRQEPEPKCEPKAAEPQETREELERMMLEIQRKLQAMK